MMRIFNIGERCPVVNMNVGTDDFGNDFYASFIGTPTYASFTRTPAEQFEVVKINYDTYWHLFEQEQTIRCEATS